MLSVRNIFIFNLCIIVIFLIMHIVSQNTFHMLAGMFSLDEEGTIPAMFSSVMLLLISIVCLFIYKETASETDNSESFWLIFALLYCFLALDEGVGIHERVERYSGVKWVYIYTPFCAIAFASICRFLAINEKSNSVAPKLIIGGLVVFFIGAAVAELISHWYRPLPYKLQQIEHLTEEALEMLGTAIVLAGCLTKLNETKRTKPVSF
jgi:small-conductance mechanosensitive channel